MVTPLEAGIAGRNIFLLAEAAEIIKILKARGISPVLVKGTALLLTIYKNDFSKRPVSDIDIFLPPGKMKSAIGILKKHGFLRMIGGEEHYARPLSGERHGVIVDLHDSLPFLSKSGYKEMLNRSVSAKINGVETRVLNAADEFVYLVYHAAVQHGGMNPVWTEDLDRIVRRNLENGNFDWNSAARFIRKQGFGLPAACHLENLREIRGTQVPNDFIKKCLPSGTRGAACNVYRRLTEGAFVPDRGHVLRIFTERGFSRFFYIVKFAFISPSFASARYGTGGGTVKTASAILSRPFLVAAKTISLARKIMQWRAG